MARDVPRLIERDFDGRLRRMLALLVLGAGVAACVPTIDTRGHVPNPDALARIEPGVQTREQVFELLGTPSSVGTFDDRRWYYITRRTESIAFYDPTVLDQRVVVVEFDQAGVVESVRELSAADAREIQPVDRVTPTRGKELGLLEQLFGNLGRFNPASQ